MDCLQHVKRRYPMTIRHLTLGLGMVLLLAGAGNSAEVKTKHLSCTFAGTFVSLLPFRLPSFPLISRLLRPLILLSHVDGCHCVSFYGCAFARSTAFTSARLVYTLAKCARYSAEAKISPVVSMPVVAWAAAWVRAPSSGILPVNSTSVSRARNALLAAPVIPTRTRAQ